MVYVPLTPFHFSPNPPVIARFRTEGEEMQPLANAGGKEDDDEDDDDDESEAEMPEDIQELPTAAQRMRRIKIRATWQMLAGTMLVVFFSDPMVDCLSELAKRSGIPPFYVAFILAPLASNAAELVAAFNYASKKTRSSITIALSTLTGAACMNNTLCLGIFLALMAIVKIDGKPAISWDFTAETISILFVQIVMFALCCKRTQPLWFAIVSLSLYPLSIAMTAILEGPGGLH